MRLTYCDATVCAVRKMAHTNGIAADSTGSCVFRTVGSITVSTVLELLFAEQTPARRTRATMVRAGDSPIRDDDHVVDT